MEIAIEKLNEVLDEAKVTPCHGIEHALIVVRHVEAALEAQPEPLSDEQRLAIKLAALIHDADDRKFFPTSKELTNARKVLSSIPISEGVSELVLKMIGLVSCSKNGNSKEGVEHEWMLYPRFADRLEAIGEIGIVRCWVYTYHVNRPLFTSETPRPKTSEELQAVASLDRFAHYVSAQGKVGSSSFIDHFYDKLFHIGEVGSNPYFVKEARRRLKIMEDFIFKFGQTGEIDEEHLRSLAVQYQVI